VIWIISAKESDRKFLGVTLVDRCFPFCMSSPCVWNLCVRMVSVVVIVSAAVPPWLRWPCEPHHWPGVPTLQVQGRVGTQASSSSISHKYILIVVSVEYIMFDHNSNDSKKYSAEIFGNSEAYQEYRQSQNQNVLNGDSFLWL